MFEELCSERILITGGRITMQQNKQQQISSQYRLSSNSNREKRRRDRIDFSLSTDV